jgi:TetR/AcrR family transcriptional repressor of nem operon
MRNPNETRAKLLETALQLIWQSNYTSVGVNEICARAGVTKGAFYHHLETKADLYCAASSHYWEGMKADLDRIFSPANAPLEQLEQMIGYVLARQHSEQNDLARGSGQEVLGCPFFTAGGQVGAGEDKVRRVAVEMCAYGVRYTEALVRGLKADGYLNGEPCEEQVGRLVYEYIHGLLMYGRIVNSLEIVERDLSKGIYRLLDVKQAYRRAGAPARDAAAVA